jgi:cytochrome c5
MGCGTTNPSLSVVTIFDVLKLPLSFVLLPSSSSCSSPSCSLSTTGLEETFEEGEEAAAAVEEEEEEEVDMRDCNMCTSASASSAPFSNFKTAPPSKVNSNSSSLISSLLDGAPSTKPGCWSSASRSSGDLRGAEGGVFFLAVVAFEGAKCAKREFIVVVRSAVNQYTSVGGREGLRQLLSTVLPDQKYGSVKLSSRDLNVQSINWKIREFLEKLE